MPKIKLKSPSDISRLKESGIILSDILSKLAQMLVTGASGDEINTKAHLLASQFGARCSFYKFEGYPAHVCLSVNNEVVHGFPFGKILREGDIVGLDMGIDFKGYFTDSAITAVIPCRDALRCVSTKEKQKLAKTAFQCLKRTLKCCRPGYRLGDIGHAVQSLAEKRGFSVVKKLVGHGVGFGVHEAPLIPNYGASGEGIRLKPGMVLAIEPMLNAGTDDVVLDEKDGWTFRTADGAPSAHFEWTVAITNREPIVLTPLDWV
ncbi:MAG: type I methionyl aminopeptidase [Candidatus Moraniibacteriota bacterium]